MLPFNDDAREKATNSVSEHSRDQVSPSISQRDFCCDLEVQGYGEHHLDTILAFSRQIASSMSQRGLYTVLSSSLQGYHKVCCHNVPMD